MTEGTEIPMPRGGAFLESGAGLRRGQAGAALDGDDEMPRTMTVFTGFLPDRGRADLAGTPIPSP
ncbi:hypothetical protein GCM10022221_78260 [Actinocorallia aurea]